MSKVLIKRYPNRKLYDTNAKRYITLESISDLIVEGYDVEVKDHETGEDLTSVTLSQIIFEREKKDSGFLPSALLANLIRTGGDTLDYMRRSMHASMGAVRMLEAAVDQRIDALVRRGEIDEVEAELLREEIKSGSAETLTPGYVDTRIEAALHRLKIPSRVDLLRLQQQVDDLSLSLGSMLESLEQPREDSD